MKEGIEARLSDSLESALRLSRRSCVSRCDGA